jgi:hypothetical protein
MINDKPHWYTTEYLNRFNVQLLTESDKSEAEKDTVIFHGPFKTVEEAIEFEKEVPYCTWTWEEEGTTWEEEGAWNTSCANQFVVNNGTPSENGMVYCCYCGRKLKEARQTSGGEWSEEDDNNIHLALKLLTNT